MSPPSNADPVVLTATYLAFPKSAWISIGLAACFLAGAIKFAVTGVWSIVPWPLGAAAAFLLWPFAAWRLRGILEVTATHIRGRRPIGSFEIARDSIDYIRPYGRPKRDNVGVELVLRDRTRRAISRIKPAPAIQTLLGLHPQNLRPAGAPPLPRAYVR